MNFEHTEAQEIVSQLDHIEDELSKEFQELGGVEIERKYFAIAIHYRNAPPGVQRQIRKSLNRALAKYPDLKTGKGKKLLEVKPAIDWHKGRAVEWIMQQLRLPFPGKYLPVYFGDDLTDEDAFRFLADDGIGILIGGHGQPTAADLYLSDTGQVDKMLQILISQCSPFQNN
jgi:trehalose-phosphatase